MQMLFCFYTCCIELSDLYLLCRPVFKVGYGVRDKFGIGFCFISGKCLVVQW